MKLEIETDDFDIIDSHAVRAEEVKPEFRDSRQWGERTWLYKGDIVFQVSGESAAAIQKIKNQEEKPE